MLALASRSLSRSSRKNDDGDQGCKFHQAKEHWVHGIVRDRDWFNALFRAGHVRLDAGQQAVLHGIAKLSLV